MCKTSWARWSWAWAKQTIISICIWLLNWKVWNKTTVSRNKNLLGSILSHNFACERNWREEFDSTLITPDWHYRETTLLVRWYIWIVSDVKTRWSCKCCVLVWFRPKSVFVSQEWNLMSTTASTLICSRTVCLRGRPSEPLMFVWPGRKFVPLISSIRTRLNLWLTHLSISFAKYGLVRIDHLFENGASQRLAVGTFDVCLARLARPKVCPTDIVRPHSAQLMIDASVNQFCKTWPSADWPYDSSVNKSCVMRGKALKPVPSPFLTYHVNRKIPLAKLWHLSEFRNTHVKLVCSWIPNWVKFQCPFLFKLVGDSKVPSNTAGFSFKICLKTNKFLAFAFRNLAFVLCKREWLGLQSLCIMECKWLGFVLFYFLLYSWSLSYTVRIMSFSSYNRYKLNSHLTCFQRGFIAQLVEHRTGITEVMGSNPLGASECFLGFNS